MRDLPWHRPTERFACAMKFERTLHFSLFRFSAAPLKYYFSINICIDAAVCVCAALLWQSVHINMSVLFACRLLLWPMPTTTASPSPSPSSSFFFLSGCDLCAYICYNIAAPSPSHTHTHTHSRYTTPTRSQPHRAGALYMPWAISVAYFYGRTFCQHSTREREREGERTRSLGVFLFCCCVTRGNNWILLGVFIYLFIFRRFLWFEHFSDFAISPLSPPPSLPCSCTLLYPFTLFLPKHSALSHIYLHEYFSCV